MIDFEIKNVPLFCVDELLSIPESSEAARFKAFCSSIRRTILEAQSRAIVGR